MAENNHSEVVSVVYPVCCGPDVRKEKISACVIFNNVFGGHGAEIEKFSTFTDDLLRLRNWLIRHEYPIVATESTGICRRPVHNVPEGYPEVIPVNAATSETFRVVRRILRTVNGRRVSFASRSRKG